MWRNVGVMLFIFALPVMQVILFCLAIGRDPTGLKLAVVNNEMIGGVSNWCVSFLKCSFIEMPLLRFPGMLLRARMQVWKSLVPLLGPLRRQHRQGVLPGSRCSKESGGTGRRLGSTVFHRKLY